MKKDKNFIISIDQGTTSSRSILFNLNGQPIYSSQKEFTQYFPKNGWVEHDPDEIWRKTKKTLSDVISKAKKLKGKILKTAAIYKKQKQDKNFTPYVANPPSNNK